MNAKSPFRSDRSDFGFLADLVTSLTDLERIRRNRLLDLIRYYAGSREFVCPACLREAIRGGNCPQCSNPLVPAPRIVARVTTA